MVPASARPPTVFRAPQSPLRPHHNVGEALGLALRTCLTQIVANQPAALDGRNPEGVHQMRVALRRGRAVLATFRSAIPDDARTWLKDEFAWLARELGPTRELDVATTELLPPVREAFDNEAVLMSLEAALETERAESYARLRTVLRSRRYTRLVLELGTWIENGGWRTTAHAEQRALQVEPLDAFGHAALDRLLKKVRQRGKGFKKLDPAGRHRFRIALKGLRYGAEFFAPLFPKKRTRPFLKALGRLQDELGAFNDAAGARSLLARVRERHRDQEGMVTAAAMMAAWHACAARTAEMDLRAAWARFRRKAPFWER